MKISIVTSDGNINILHLPENETNDIIIQLIAAEVSIPLNEIRILHYGNEYTYNKFHTLLLQNDDIISVDRIIKKKINIHDLPKDLTPEKLLQLVDENPHLLTQLENNDNELANAIKSKDIREVRGIMMKRILDQQMFIFEQRQEEEKIFSDPDSEENQRKIAEKIRLQNIQASMETAMEEIPESFGVVQMLYINIELNGHPIKAFVDSGAQSTIISAECAERCGLSRLIDTRFAGQARGVGTAPILGRIHLAQMKLQTNFFPISITVLQGSDIDFLFGLDMLRRHQCCIDLKKNVLRVEGFSGIEECPFLSEDQIPKKSSNNIHPVTSLASPKRGRSNSFHSDYDPFDESILESLRQNEGVGISHGGLTGTGIGTGSGSSSSVGSNGSIGATPAPSSNNTTTTTTTGNGNNIGLIPTSYSTDSNDAIRRSESGRFVNSDVIHLCSLGFSIVEASNALSQAEGDVELAAQLLFSSRL